jgi:glutamate synthase domain-containing protein 2
MASKDDAVFPNVDLERVIGADKSKGITCTLPVVIPGMGSTNVARNNWKGLAAGAALSGVPMVIGENVVGMDPDAKYKRRKVVDAPRLKNRIECYTQWQQKGRGAIAVQENVEDNRAGVLEYAIRELGVQVVELKWGQGAKDIGGEVKVRRFLRAKMLKDRGYLVLPDPDDEAVEDAHDYGIFSEFERHSRIGFVRPDEFLKRVEKLRSAGAKHVFLKTGAYRPSDLALALKLASDAEIDLLTIDGAGGGTGMSPWPMMNEWGIPTLYLAAIAYRYAKTLQERGAHVPDIAMAGGISLEDHIFKILAVGAPFFKLAGMGRAPLTAAMVGKTVGFDVASSKVPSHLRKVESAEEVFLKAFWAKDVFGDDYAKEYAGAVGVVTYFERVTQGLQQLMCGARKFNLDGLSRDDIASLTQLATDVTGIPYIMDLDAESADRILSGDFSQYEY